jgi:hypothetical protein
MKPQPAPADTLRKVIKIARFNGMIVVCIVACACALVTLALGDISGAFFCLLAAAAGWSEWHGAKLLQRGRERGIKWLVRSQLYLLAIILLYVLTRMLSYDSDYGNLRSNIEEMSQLSGMNIDEMLQNIGLTMEDTLRLVRTAFYTMYGTFALVAVFYQGGLALYYHRRAAAIRTALGESGSKL